MVTSVPETPESLLPTPPGRQDNQQAKKKRQRRKARILSSSDEDEGQPICSTSPPCLGNTTSSLFSKFPMSKRRKRETNEDQGVTSKPEDCKSGLQETNPLHGNPRRLFQSSGADKESGQLSCSNHHGNEMKAAASHGKLERRKGKIKSLGNGGVGWGWATEV